MRYVPERENRIKALRNAIQYIPLSAFAVGELTSLCRLYDSEYPPAEEQLEAIESKMRNIRKHLF